MQVTFEIIDVDRKAVSMFDNLYACAKWICSYFKMASISWSPGEFNIYFTGNVSPIVEATITRLIYKKFGTKLVRQGRGR
jgi:hypothetical protein